MGIDQHKESIEIATADWRTAGCNPAERKSKTNKRNVIQRNFAASIALYRDSRTQETVIPRLMDERNQNGFSPLDQ